MKSQKVEKVNKNKLFERVFKHLCEDAITYEKYLYALVPQNEMDLMFIVDCTGSMGSWIEAVKKEIFLIVKGVQNKFKTSCIRLSFVGYRDLTDKPRFSIFPFNNDWRKFHKFVSSVRACGGGDYPEDVYGGFQEALKQNWSCGARYAVFIADAPCHGNQYHDGNCGDSYPKGDPSGIPVENFMKDFAEKNIHFFSGKIASGNDKMMKIFSNVYKEHSQREIGEAPMTAGSKDFSRFIMRTALETIQGEIDESGRASVDFEAIYNRIVQTMRTNTEYSASNRHFAYKFNETIEAARAISIAQAAALKTDNRTEEQRLKDMEIEEQEEKPDGFLMSLVKRVKSILPLSKDGKKVEATCHTFEIQTNPEDPTTIAWEKPLLFTKKSVKRNIDVQHKPLAKGATNYIVNINDGRQLVGRIPIVETNDSLEEVIQKNQQYIIAEKILNEMKQKSFFCIFEIEINGKKLLIPAELLSDGRNVDKKLRTQPCEFNDSGIFKQSVSHFSYQYTKGMFLIANFGQVSENWSDGICQPLVYSLNPRIIAKESNQSYLGFFKFFTSHSCGLECEEHQLISVSDFASPNAYNFKLPIEE